MSETILRILLDELVKVRIVCDRCQSSVEVSIDVLTQGSDAIRCPGCAVMFRQGQPSGYGSQTPDSFHNLGRALHALRSAPGGDKHVEFVLPVKDE